MDPMNPSLAENALQESCVQRLCRYRRANASEICWAIRRQPQVGLRCFIATTTSMISLSGSFGPGRLLRLAENSVWYFGLIIIRWKCNRVDGFRMTADLRTLAGRIRRVHKPAIIRSETRRFGA